ncbi:Acyl-CoA hydrolase [Paucidesulfovibrio gracilis DSM 16080]|uniref:Acyl-CoA hydrolase n=1 Tax=Paucidesulfovibrio gracilis DSM 16080 TaxID=1121449 RepID=A0A1T4XLG0_9BACT|nr:acyl-CoA thioesterase [Paucidesulfovibrio gracilis]SKA90334.1 Acyl-CoA hydrolase [Paucidesulfovibrio gracilis DSM 16080]
MKAKAASQSAVIMSHIALPEDANPSGNLHGGVILKHVDTAGGVVAMRHARANVVTASFERMDFLLPAYVGELLTIKASLNYVGHTSMEVGVRVEAENPITGEVRHTNSAYVTYVALDENGKPRSVPPLDLDSDTARRRWTEAENRRKMREDILAAESR